MAKTELDYQTLTLKITGESPLIFHNGQLANPMNYWSRKIKEVSSKRKKVDSDFEEMAKLEFLGSLYLKNGEPCIPAEMIHATFINGAKKSKSGNVAKAGLVIKHGAPLIYEGPRKPEELWADENFRLQVPVKVGTSKVIRTRPIFHDWSCEVELEFDPALLNSRDVLEFAVAAGRQVGFGDWRPQFGRFGAEEVVALKKAA